MKTIDCPGSKKLIQFNDEKLAEQERKQITIHLRTCERCSTNLQLLKNLDEVLFMENKKIKRSGLDYYRTDACLSDDLLYRYLDGRVTESEAETIEKHLNVCKNCLNDVASIVTNSLTPATESEQAEIARMRMITPEEQVVKILEYSGYPSVKEPIEGKRIKIAAIIKEKFKKFFEKWIYTRYTWRPAIAFAVLFIFIVGIRSGVRYYNTGYQISRAEKILSEFYKVPNGDARLTGGFAPSSLGELMAPNEEKPAYVDEVKSKVNIALKKSSNSLTARQLLAKVYIIEKQISKADSIFLQIETESVTSALLLNDIGVLYFHKKNWKQAADYFQSAIEIDTNLPEAYYNLALAKNNLNQFDDALSNLDQFLKIEDDENWRRFALQLIDEINNNLEELK